MICFVSRTFSLCPYLEFPASSSCFHRPFYPLPFSLSFSIECNGGGYSDDAALETEKTTTERVSPPWLTIVPGFPSANKKTLTGPRKSNHDLLA